MSAIDALLKQHLENVCKENDKNNCVFVQDVASLRAAASEAAALRATVSQHAHEYAEWQAALTNAGARIAALEATCAEQAAQLSSFLDLLIEYNAVDASDLRGVISSLDAKIEAQARKIEAALATVDGQATQLHDATNLIRRVWEMADDETSKVEIETTSLMWQIEADTRAWLAENAPEPAPAAAEVTK